MFKVIYRNIIYNGKQDYKEIIGKKCIRLCVLRKHYHSRKIYIVGVV